jgi:hypothetical protein
MSFVEIINEIPRLSPVERQSLMLELKRQEQQEASSEFALMFARVTELELQDGREQIELADALQRHVGSDTLP